jgi:thiol:disulfide interchange protein DsbA
MHPTPVSLRAALRALLAAGALLLATACSDSKPPEAQQQTPAPRSEPAASAGAAQPIEQGRQYQAVHAAQPTDVEPGKILVEEVFWYGCQHCYHFDPLVQSWADRLPADVVFRRLPSSLGRPEGLLHSRAFFAAQALGIQAQIHKPMFDAIHVAGFPMNTPDAITALFTQQAGVLPDVVGNTLNSEAVSQRVAQAEARVQEYGVASVPTLVVDGRYMSDATMTGGFEGLLSTAGALIERQREARAASGQP